MVVKETSRHQMAEHDFVSDLDGVGEQGETHKRTAGPRCAIRRFIFLEETFLHGTPHQVQEQSRHVDPMVRVGPLLLGD